MEDKTNKIDKIDKMEKIDKIDKMEKIDKTDKIGLNDKPCPVLNMNNLTYINNIKSDKNDHLNLYLWILHGSNVSQHNNYYLMETKFQALVFYSKPFSTINVDDLKKTLENTCELITGSCPIIPTVNSLTGKKEVALPPLIFFLYREDNEDVKLVSGLYHFVLTKKQLSDEVEEKKSICSIVSQDRVYDHSKFINRYGEINVTYSQLFNEVLIDCKKKKLNPEEVMLGFFTCQDSEKKYKNEYNTKIKDLAPRILNTQSKYFEFNK
jgi:hypothetical protein